MESVCFGEVGVRGEFVIGCLINRMLVEGR